jgi:hypothetical protein
MEAGYRGGQIGHPLQISTEVVIVMFIIKLDFARGFAKTKME